jgi:hypothetical protein
VNVVLKDSNRVYDHWVHDPEDTLEAFTAKWVVHALEVSEFNYKPS